METTIVAVYDTVPDAEAAVRELVNSGYDRSDISLVANDTLEEYTPHLDEEPNGDDGAVVGSSIGAVLGGLGGVLLGLGALTIPGIGPLLAAGPLAAVLGGLVGAGTGALAGGALGALADALMDVGVPEEEARFYAESVRRGGTLVAVQAAQNDKPDIQRILNRHRPVNIHERVGGWQEEGWTGYNPAASPYTQDQIEQERARYHRDTPYTAPASDEFDEMQPDFERHYSETYMDAHDPYDYYRPAYYYGYQLAHYDRYADWDWPSLEPEARRYWEQREDLTGAWEDFEAAVHYGWARTREALRELFN